MSCPPIVDSETKSNPNFDPETKSESESNSDPVRRRFMMMHRADFPKRDFNFSNVPVRSSTEPGSYSYHGSAYGLPICKDLTQLLTGDPVVESAVHFILLTESDETFSDLHCHGCHVKHNFLLVKPTADVTTCYFLRMLKTELGGIPIYALVDYDPNSVKLLDFLETWIPEGMPQHLAEVELDIRWLGLRNMSQQGPYACIRMFGSTSITPICISLGCVAKMDDDDFAVAKSLLDTKFVNKSEARVAEVKRMIDMKWMMEVMALVVHSFEPSYLPGLFEVAKSTWI